MVVINMTIIIPSKNIYEISNPKIRDNVIERIEVNAKNVVPNNEFDTTVFIQEYSQDEIENISAYGDKIEEFGVGREYAGTVYSNGYGVAYLGITPYYLPMGDKDSKVTITIPKVFNNSTIQSIKSGLNNSEKNIGITIEYYKSWGTISGTCVVSNEGANQELQLGIISWEGESEVEKANTLPIDFEHSYTWDSQNVVGQSYTQEVNIESKFNENTLDNVGTARFRQDENNFYIDLKVFCGYQRIALGGYTPPKAGGTPSSSVTVNLSGTVEAYSPTSLEITFKGNKIGISLNDKVVYVNGSAQKKVYSAEGSELMQTSNYLKDSGENAIETMYGETRNQYRNGKETAVIRCSIGNYYDDFGEKVISIDEDSLPMTFSIGDIVRPMIYSVGGVDKPMSLYNGEAKTFCVVGRKPYYNGAVWQELTLQEV